MRVGVLFRIMYLINILIYIRPACNAANAMRTYLHHYFRHIPTPTYLLKIFKNYPDTPTVRVSVGT